MSDPRDAVAAIVREADFTAFAAAQFAPADARPHLLALRAFDAELARVRSIVSDPMVGEIRLQWWRDALESPDRADAVAHPVARALEAAIAFGSLPREALLSLVDARADDLYDDPVPTLGELEGRLGATHSALIRLGSLILGHGQDPGGAEAAGYGGVAQGVARLLARLPAEASRGRVMAPVETMAAHGVSREDVISGKDTRELAAAAAELRALASRRLAEARAAFEGVDPVAAPAFLPLAVVPDALRSLGRRK
ncbi:MAG: squalene/phytoene synthase family protein, partial [Hansschlegelia sp.]